MNPNTNNYLADVLPEPGTGKVVDGTTFTALVHLPIIDMHYRSRFQLLGVERVGGNGDRSAETQVQMAAARDCLTLLLIGPHALEAGPLTRPTMGVEVVLSPNKPNVYNRAFVSVYRPIERQSPTYPFLCYRNDGRWFLDVNRFMVSIGGHKFDLALARNVLTEFSFSLPLVGGALPALPEMEKVESS